MMKFKKFLVIILCCSLIIFLSACTDEINDAFKRFNNEIESVFNEIEKAIDSPTEYDTQIDINDEGLELIDEGKAEEALDYFYKNLEAYVDRNIVTDIYSIDSSIKDIVLPYIDTEEEILDVTLTNISLAYTHLGDYKKSLEYIDEAMKILPNTAEEYVLKGIIFYNLNELDKALENYDEALENDGYYNYAYYGKGEILVELQRYEEALENFDSYLELEPDDADAESLKAYCFLYTEGKDEAIRQINETIDKNETYYDVYYMKGLILEESGTYDEIEDFYEDTSELFKDNILAKIDLGVFYYNYGMYNKSLQLFEKIIESDPDNLNLYTWVIYNHTALEEYEQALQIAETALKKDDEYDELYNAMGNIYLEKTLYLESIDYFNKAIELNPLYEDAYINKIYALYAGKRYAKAIEFGMEAEELFPYSYDILWYIAESQYELDQLDEAIESYEKMINLDPDDDEILSYLAYTYLLLEDYDNAKKYMEQTLAINSENYTALMIKDELKSKQLSIVDQVMNFFSTYYLYNNDGHVENKINNYSDEKITRKALYELIDQMKQPDDIFTFAVYGEDYDYFMGIENQDFSYDILSENLIYTKVDTFAMNTDNKFIELLDSIENSEAKTLIIDLRDNAGGDTTSANNMLDALLPECVTSTLIDKDGFTTNYYSDASLIPFKQIYIFVNENSASASELLTLGLKTYLNNVTIVGRNTFGKGVGQYVYEDKQNKLILLVVNHYWNVRQTNIMDVGIAPDIYIQEDSLDQYLNVVK